MMHFDRARFFADFPGRTGLRLTPERQRGLDFLLGAIERDPLITVIRHAAYLLATIRHETWHKFAPIREVRAKAGTDAHALQERYWHTGFYGRGYVQITWRRNYAAAGALLKGRVVAGRTIGDGSFLNDPALALNPEAAYAIASSGMATGMFTGRRFADYINDGRTDYTRARRIINGLDHAEEVAAMAQQFELLLRAAKS
ncbi:MAG: hypothetical protein ACRCZI_11190 [Cetobacterium sp.]